MQVFLLRHGTRDFTTGDVPLNDLGLQEARALSQRAEFSDLKTILSSPKKRAQMTLMPLSEAKGRPIKTLPDLDQMRAQETGPQFTQRVKKVLDALVNKQWPGPLILCSHSDWLSLALQIIPSDEANLKHEMFRCAQFMEFFIEDDIWYRKS